MKNLRIFAIHIIVFFVAIFIVLGCFNRSPNEIVKYETYVWVPLYEDPIEGLQSSPYQPIIVRVNEEVQEQTGISLENVVRHGAEVTYNFAYTDESPLVTGYCDSVKILVDKNGKEIGNYDVDFSQDETP